MIHTSMFQKHIHKVNFYPSADDFTQALLVMLVTNIMSASLYLQMYFHLSWYFWMDMRASWVVQGHGGVLGTRRIPTRTQWDARWDIHRLPLPI